MRVLVCGGRGFDDFELFKRVMQALSSATTYIHGDAPGADRMVDAWADDSWGGRQYVERYPADWETFGKAAGHIRNQQMLDEGKPDLVVAFPGGKGTENMIQRARRAGVPVLRVEP